MKKLLLTLFSVLLMASSAFAETKTETFDFEQNDYGLERNASGYTTNSTITSGDISIVLTKTAGNGWRLWSDGLRGYKGNGPVMTVKAGENKITKIDFTMFKANIITKYNSTSVDTKATSFTVDCNGASEFELLFNVANNGAITNMVITYETEDDVPAEDTVAPITFTANTTPH